jgi:hypothetical protein
MALTATGTAEAATASSHHLSVSPADVSCLTATRCVAVGESGNSGGDVTTLGHGAQSHVTVVSAAEYLGSVSCPSKAGCWAVGPAAVGNKLVLVKINSSGRVARTVKVKQPLAVLMSQISCVSMTSCELEGEDVLTAPIAVEVGSWSGRRLSLHKVGTPVGSTDTTVTGISCWHAYCNAVGYLEVGASTYGVVVATSHGKPGKLHRTAGDFFSGVSCVSTTKCYADGYDSLEGIIVTVRHGIAAGRRTISLGYLFGIECAGSACTAAGSETDAATKSGFAGYLVVVSAGVPGAPRTIVQSGGYRSICRRGSGRGFAALGLAQGDGAEVTIG